MKHQHESNEWCGQCFSEWLRELPDEELNILSSTNMAGVTFRHAIKIKKLPMRVTREISPIIRDKPPRL